MNEKETGKKGGKGFKMAVGSGQQCPWGLGQLLGA